MTDKDKYTITTQHDIYIDVADKQYLTIKAIEKWHCKKHNKIYDIQYPECSPGITLTDKDTGKLFHFGLCCWLEFFKNNMEPLLKIEEIK